MDEEVKTTIFRTPVPNTPVDPKDHKIPSDYFKRDLKPIPNRQQRRKNVRKVKHQIGDLRHSQHIREQRRENKGK